jgi:hypothetical protein
MQLQKPARLISAIYTNQELRYGYCNRSVTFTVLENGRSPANQTRRNIKIDFDIIEIQGTYMSAHFFTPPRFLFGFVALSYAFMAAEMTVP